LRGIGETSIVNLRRLAAVVGGVLATAAPWLSESPPAEPKLP
jgi:hypothetical protein